MTYQSSMTKNKKLPPEMDPILPLVAGGEIPDLKQGTGKFTMQNETLVQMTLPYRAFYLLWEQAERRAAKQYPKYVGGPMDHVAQAWLDAVHSMRSSAAGEEIRRYSEEKAQKARALRAKSTKGKKA